MPRPPSARAGAPVVVSGAGVISPLGNTLAAFDAALFAGRSAVRAQALDLPGIELPPVPVAPADFDAAAEVAPSRVPLDRADGDGPRRSALCRGGRASRPRRLRSRPARHLLGQRHGRRGDLRGHLPHGLCRSPPDAAHQRRDDDAERAAGRDRPPLRRPRRRARLCLRLRLVGGRDRRGDACHPRRLDRRRHRRRQRVDADAGRARELAGDARAGAARHVGRRRRGGRGIVPAVRRRPRRLRARRSGGGVRSRVGRACARARRAAAARTDRLRDQLRWRPHHQSRRAPVRRGRCAPRSPTPGSKPTPSATSMPTARRRFPAMPPKPNRSPPCSAPTACRSARPRRSTATCSAPAARSSCWRRCAPWRRADCRRLPTRAPPIRRSRSISSSAPRAARADLRHAMSNSFAFGGTNAVLVASLA